MSIFQQFRRRRRARQGPADRRRQVVAVRCCTRVARMSTDAKPKAGLEDVVAGESAICYLDGDRGVLAYQGYDIHDLANAERGASFEEVCYLLWHGRLPTRAELGDLQTQLAAARALPEPILRAMRSLPPVDGMDALRTLTSMLGHYDPDAARHVAAGELPQGRAADRADRRRSSRPGAGMAAGGGPIDPDPALGHAANFLYMLTGTAAVGAGDAGLRRVARAARRPRAERLDVRRARRRRHADRHPLGHRRRHRRAEGPAARRRERRRDEDAARHRQGRRRRSAPRQYVRAQARAQGEDSGFGHRVYHTEDPRATHLRRFSKSLGEKAGQPQWFAMSQRIEALVTAREEAESERRLLLGVDVLLARAFRSISTRRSSP